MWPSGAREEVSALRAKARPAGDSRKWTQPQSPPLAPLSLRCRIQYATHPQLSWLFQPTSMPTGDGASVGSAPPRQRRVRLVEPERMRPPPPRPASNASSSSSSTAASELRGSNAAASIVQLYGRPTLPQPPRATNTRTISPRASSLSATAVRRAPTQWERRQMFSLPLTEAISGHAAHVRAAPRQRPRTAPQLHRQRPALSQEAVLDELWNLQVSQMEFQRLLDEERYYEEAERELAAKIAAVKRSLLLQQLKRRYHERQDSSYGQNSSSPGSSSPRHRDAPRRRGARHPAVGLPWSYAGVQILQTETSLREAGWSREAIDEHLQQLFAPPSPSRA